MCFIQYMVIVSSPKDRHETEQSKEDPCMFPESVSSEKNAENQVTTTGTVNKYKVGKQSKTVDVSALPPRFRNLRKSSVDDETDFALWDQGRTSQGKQQVIITDICLNQQADIGLSSTHPKSSSTSSSQNSLSDDHNSEHSHVPDSVVGIYLNRVFEHLRTIITCGYSSQNDAKTHQCKTRKSHQRQDKDNRLHKQLDSDTHDCLSEHIESASLPHPSKQEATKVTKGIDTIAGSPSKVSFSSETTAYRQQYLNDVRVLHNVRRRELISKLFYHHSGNLFPRLGTPNEPRHLVTVLGEQPEHPPLHDPHTHASPEMENTNNQQQHIVNKILERQPSISPDCWMQPEPNYINSEFIQSCLDSHNVYRARHSAPHLELSQKLCNLAQNWANELAHSGCFRHQQIPDLGENIYCRSTNLLKINQVVTMADIKGEEVASHWYNSNRQYKYGKNSNVLQSSAGPFTQMVWKKTQVIGFGKARGQSGKIFVVAYYAPAGNIPYQFDNNVQPLNSESITLEMSTQTHQESPTLTQPANVTASRVLCTPTMPPRLMGKNATIVFAAHILGHSTSIASSQDEDIDILVHFEKKKQRRKSRSNLSSKDS
ncbi:unnamed protein product, partial [Meganyctiphanes norvegica]